MTDDTPGDRWAASDDPLRPLLLRIGKVVAEVIEDHLREHHGRAEADDPPGRALRALASALHTGNSPTGTDEPPGLLLLRVGRAVERTILEMLDAHELNYHARGPQAFDGYALAEQIRQDAALRALLVAVLLGGSDGS